MNTKLVNLTAHTLTEVSSGKVIPASGIVARVFTRSNLVTKVAGIPVFQTELGELEGLPEPVEGTTYIVSALCLHTATSLGRTDVVSPGNLKRDENGNTIGCFGFRKL